MNIKRICIEGNIGAGKTSLAKKMADFFNATLVLENFENNPYLESFYINSEKYALQVELSFLADRYHQLLQFNNCKHILIADYFFDKNLLFAQINLKPNELKIFKAAFDEAKKQILPPDLIIFLDATEELLIKNIKNRGRNFESGIASAYLQKITNAYYAYFNNKMTNCTTLWVNANEYDLINNELLFKRFIEKIQGELGPKINFF